MGPKTRPVGATGPHLDGRTRERDRRRSARVLLAAHDQFLATGRVVAPVRGLVLDSWRRSLEAGVEPESTQAVLRLDPDTVRRHRAEHPLAGAMPLIRHLLVDSAADAGLLVAVSDAAGRLLWVEGDHGLRSRAEGMHFCPGADWSETAVGTNAPGTALALDRPVQILGAEHLARPVTPWSCSAAPIHDPDTGAVLGVLDVTGGEEVVSVQSLTLVRATVAAVESELRLERMRADGAGRLVGGARSTGAGPHLDTLRLEVLGAHGAVLRSGSAVRRLGLRHSEISLLLSEALDGLTAAELAAALSDRDGPDVTVRAELARLRTVLGGSSAVGAGAVGPVLASRPYRFTVALRSDLAEVRDALAAGDYRRAVAAYRGPVLPASEAPAVAELREDLHGRLRSSLLRSRDPDALLRFADTDHGRTDVPLWEAALAALPPGSGRRPQVRDHLDRLLRTLG